MMGPFFLLPGIAATSAGASIVGIRANPQTRRGLLYLGLLSVFVPAGLQLAGVIPASYAFEDGALKILPAMIQFEAVPTLLFLAGVAALQITAMIHAVGGATERLVHAERMNFAQAWRLRKLIPAGEPG